METLKNTESKRYKSYELASSIDHNNISEYASKPAASEALLHCFLITVKGNMPAGYLVSQITIPTNPDKSSNQQLRYGVGSLKKLEHHHLLGENCIRYFLIIVTDNMPAG